jgi:hypothetical protein
MQNEENVVNKECIILAGYYFARGIFVSRRLVTFEIIPYCRHLCLFSSLETSVHP